MNPIILTPIHYNLENAHVDSILKIKCDRITTIGCPHVAAARSYLISQVPDEYDILVFIDSDIAFEPRDFDRLIAQCNPRTVISGTYRGKCEPQQLIGKPTKALSETKYQAEYVGAGFLAIHSDAIDTMKNVTPVCKLGHWQSDVFHYFMPIIVDGLCLEDDWAFSYRARQSRINLVIDTEIRVKHYGSYGFTVDKL